MCISRRWRAILALATALVASAPSAALAADSTSTETTHLAFPEAALLVVAGTGLLALIVWHVRLQGARRAAQLEAANAHQRTVIDAIPDALFRMDAEGRFLEFKPSPDFTPVIPEQEFLGKTVRETELPSNVIIAWEGALETVRRDGGYRAAFYRLDYPDGPHEFEARMVQSQAGEYLAIVRDISAIRQAEADAESYRRQLELTVTRRTSDLIEANVRLQEANRAKSVFLTNVSHELRTPLNSVIGFTDLLLTGLAGDLNDEQRHQMTMIRGAGKELLSLVDDVLDYTRIESGRISALPARFRLPNLLADCLARVRNDAQIRGLGLQLDVDDALVTMESDRRLIEQIVLDLLSNAIKFTSSGSVTLGARPVDDETVAIEVTDTGHGIDPETMAKMYQAFEQGAGKGAIRPQGLGLGLAVCQELTGLLCGSIEMESTPGHGTKARVLLPLHLKIETDPA